MKNCFSFIFAVLFMGFSLYANTHQFSAPEIKFEQYTLPNGLTVILSQDKKTPFVHISAWYKVGALDEDPKKNQTGLAHLFEHLSFEGTKHYKADDHFNLLYQAGASGLNASTSFSFTNYYQKVPKGGALELALSLESSRMFFLNLTEEKRKEQLAVVTRELELRYKKPAYAEANLKIWHTIFPKTSPLYGNVIGSEEDLEAAKLADLQNFYDEFYGPSNATLALVGDFEVDEVKTLINKYFATLPKTKSFTRKPAQKVVLKEEKIINFDEKIGTMPMISIKWLTPGVYEKGDAELDVLSYILTGGEFGRLTKALTRDEKLASYVGASQMSMENQSVFSMYALLDPATKSDVLINKIDEVLLDLQKNPPTMAEINRAKYTLITQNLLNLQRIGNKSDILQSYKIFTGDPGFLAKDIERYEKITVEDLTTTLKQFLPIKTSRAILIANPKK